MSFTMVRGGQAIEPEPTSEDAPCTDTADTVEGEQEAAEYQDAYLLNQRLKAMLAEAEVAEQLAQQRVAPNSGRSGQRRVPRPPVSSSDAHSRQSTQMINRRKSDEKVRQENANIASRLAGSKSCILPPVALPRTDQQESSQSINRRKFAEKVQRENAHLVSRIEQPARAKSWGPPRRIGESELPRGWTRGIGGRAMPPPKMRWGAAPKYDAGDWAS